MHELIRNRDLQNLIDFVDNLKIKSFKIFIDICSMNILSKLNIIHSKYHKHLYFHSIDREWLSVLNYSTFIDLFL